MAQIKKTTPAGTISATSFNDGICVGKYPTNSVVSLEYSEREGCLVLLLNREQIKRDKVKVITVDYDWKPIDGDEPESK